MAGKKTCEFKDGSGVEEVHLVVLWIWSWIFPQVCDDYFVGSVGQVLSREEPLEVLGVNVIEVEQIEMLGRTSLTLWRML